MHNKFSKGVDTIYSQVDEEKLWQLYLSIPIKEKSFIEWRNEIVIPQKKEKIKNVDFEAAKKEARNILKTFKPY